MKPNDRDKRVLWDADFYNSLPDEYCMYCLSKKQIYLIGQAILPQMRWATRWYGDTSELDIDAIASEVESKLEMPECDNIFNLLYDLQAQIISLQQTVENGGVPPVQDTDDINTPLYQNTSTDLQAPIGNVIVPCGTTEEKDALYGACATLADYLVTNMTDFYEIFRQSVSRISELVDRALSAIPIIETLPTDEAVELVNYWADEAVEIWDSVVTNDRIQDLRCLLFCAALANDCKLTPELVQAALASKAPDTLPEFYIYSIRDVFGIMVLGAPIGDEFFYSQLYTQVAIVLLGERFMNAQGWRPYELEFLSGLNSPDNDWSLFCTDCPDWTYYEDFRFWTDDGNEWEVVTGTYNGEFMEGIETDPDPDGNSRYVVAVRYTLPTNAKIIGAGIHFSGHHSCGTGGVTISFALDGVNTDNFNLNPTPTTEDQKRTWALSVAQASIGNEIYIQIVSDRCDGTPAFAWLHGVRLWYTSDSPRKGVLSLAGPVSLSPNGSTDIAYWSSWKEPEPE